MSNDPGLTTDEKAAMEAAGTAVLIACRDLYAGEPPYSDEVDALGEAVESALAALIAVAARAAVQTRVEALEEALDTTVTTLCGVLYLDWDGRFGAADKVLAELYDAGVLPSYALTATEQGGPNG